MAQFALSRRIKQLPWQSDLQWLLAFMLYNMWDLFDIVMCGFISIYINNRVKNHSAFRYQIIQEKDKHSNEHLCFHSNIAWMHNSNFWKIFYCQIMYVLKARVSFEEHIYYEFLSYVIVIFYFHIPILGSLKCERIHYIFAFDIV